MTWTTALLLIILNIIVWGCFHFFISYLCFIIPRKYFERDLNFFRTRHWERDGETWNRLFAVKKWKSYLIDGSSIVKKSYNKSHLHGTKNLDLTIFAAETKRAELTHWLLILPAPLFFLWNPLWAGWVMIAYALIANVPFILTQRYNRGRINSILSMKQQRKKEGQAPLAL